jgi:hypothetical protein
LDYGLRADASLHRRRAAGEHDHSSLDRCADIPCSLGALGTRLGGAQIIKAALRGGFWAALAVTAGIGALVGKAL